MTRHVTLLAPQNCSGVSLMGVMEMFDVANRISRNLGETGGALFDWHVVCASGAALQTNTGMQIALASASREMRRDILFLVPMPVASHRGVHDALAACAPEIDWLRHNAPDFEMVSTACSGGFLLAEAGLLGERTVTTSWWLRREFLRRYPAVTLAADDICVVSDGLICGGSTTAYQDVCLKLIEQNGGRHLARLVAKYMMVDNQRRSQSPYTILTMVDNDDPAVEKAIQWIRRNMHRDFRVDELAEHLGVSSRTLIRRFRKSIGESPQSFTQRVRIEKSKILLETTQMKLGDIVQRCGYSDESAFRRLFKKYCQVSPREYRRRFNVKRRDAA